MEEHQIVELFWLRSEDALEQAWEKYGRLLQQLCRNILEDPQEVEECVSDTLLALWNTIPPQRPAPLAAYACRIARNLAVKRYRDSHAQRRDSRKTLPLEELVEVLPAPSTEEQWNAKELARAMDAWLEGLKETDRVLFVRRYWFGDSVQDAAARVGLRENTASVRLRRMKLRLRDYLTQEGYMV